MTRPHSSHSNHDDEEDEPTPPRAAGPESFALLNGDTPWYVRATIIVLFYFGVPTLLVAVLLGMGAGWIPSPITETHMLAKKLEDHVRNMAEIEDAHMRMLSLICRNTSFTTSQMTECEHTAIVLKRKTP